MGNNMKKNTSQFTTIFVTIVLLTATLSFYTVADDENNYNQIIKKYSFDAPVIQQVTINNIEYDRVIMENSPNFGDLGKYNLPRYGVNILLNQGEEIANIEVNPGEKVFLGSNFNVEPVVVPTPLSETDFSNSNVEIIKDNNPKDPYPQNLFSNVGTYGFRGYEILVLQLNPVQYVPESKSLYYFKDIEVKITSIETNQINQLFRNLEKDEIEVIKKVDNPLAVYSYEAKNMYPLSSGSYDLLIITTEKFKDTFETLKEAHESNGIATKIKILRDISLIPNKIEPEDIREFIKDEYRKNGIEYVLIAGDDDLIPAQKLWVEPWHLGDPTFMPSDLYYACLDGTYNSDDDERWGEPKDGEDGNNVDLIAEVYVGRACVDTITDVYNFIDKTTEYMSNGGYSTGKTLFVGEYLWSDPDTWGGDYMDELINGSSTNSYTTLGIPADIYTVDTLYDRDYAGGDWPKSAIKSKINEGALIINHLGHSYYGYNMKMINADVYDLANDEPCFIYSQGCMAGGFDNPNEYDCIAEYFTVKTEEAAFAVIMNARYGWGVKGGTNGASQRFHRQFWDAIFGENIKEIGKANQDSKEDVLPYLNYPCIRWCYYELNLFGDPTLVFYNSENIRPNKPTKPAGAKNGATGTGIEYDFITSATDQDGDELYYKWSWGDGTFTDWLGPYPSGEEIMMTHQWSKIGLYNVKVKSRDIHRAESDWSEPRPVVMPLFPSFPLVEYIINFLEKYFPQIYSIIYKILV